MLVGRYADLGATLKYCECHIFRHLGFGDPNFN